MENQDYARWFRGSTPYISAHRNKTFVVLLMGEALQHENLVNVVHDLALLHVLGVRLVLVHGARPHINAQITDSQFVNGLRITDAQTMQTISGIHGQIRTQLEGLFSTGLPNSPLHNVDIPVVSGNFVIAQPVGTLDGVDHHLTGNVRRVEIDRVHSALSAGALLLQSPLGYSPSGQAYNLSAEQLATEIATQINADKLIVIAEQHLTTADGGREGTVTPGQLEDLANTFPEDRARLARAMAQAVRKGVEKSHLVSFQEDGALLAELFTAEGCGTQVIEAARKPVRPAALADIPGIVEVIRPLEAAGILVPRERDRLEQEIDCFLVAELDGIVVGCCAVYGFSNSASNKQAELACLAVHENYRRPSGNGLGVALLSAAEERAQAQGANELFVLTTQTTDWFRDHGFADAKTDVLPDEKQSLYNWQRGSKVMIKAI